MPTVRTVTVKSAGGDYTSLSNAEAGEQDNLVTLDRQLNIECYAMNDTTQVIFNGWTSSSTQYISVYPPTSERHSGVWSTSKYRMDSSIAFGDFVYLQVPYTRITGLQVRNSGGVGRRGIVGDASASSNNILIDSCIVAGSGDNVPGGIVLGGGSNAIVRNCVVYGPMSTGIGIDTFSTNSLIDNCTVVGNGSIVRGIIARSSATGSIVRNCYASGSSGGDIEIGTGTSKSTCATADSTGNITGKAASTSAGAYFTNVTSGSEDFNIGSLSALKGAGTDLSATFTVDIASATRSVPWDIGAFAFASSTVPLTATSTDSANNLADTLAYTLGIPLVKTDDLNNWIDTQEKLLTYALNKTEDAANLSDAIALLDAGNLNTSEDANNLSDSSTLIYGLLGSQGDAFTLTESLGQLLAYLLNQFDTLALADSIAVETDSVEKIRSAADNLNNWSDARLLNLLGLLAKADNLNNLNDAVLTNLAIQNTTPLSALAYDSMMYAWADAIAASLIVKKEFTDGFTLSDSLRAILAHLLRTGDQIILSDFSDNDRSRFLERANADSLITWADALRVRYTDLINLSVADNMNQWADSIGNLRSTGFLSYIRRYLNDVV